MSGNSILEGRGPKGAFWLPLMRFREPFECGLLVGSGGRMRCLREITGQVTGLLLGLSWGHVSGHRRR